MILDERNSFCDAVALNTGAAGTYALGDVIDLQASGLDMGQGGNLSLVVMMADAATSGGAATAAFSLVSADTATIPTDGSAKVHLSSGAFALSEMGDGELLLSMALPNGAYGRYVGLLQTTGTAAFTGGSVHAFLTIAPASWSAYADAS